MVGAAVLGAAACSSARPPAFSPGGPASAAAATPAAQPSAGRASVVMPPFGKNAHVVITGWLPRDPGTARAVIADKNYELALHVLLSFFSQPAPVYRG